MLFNSLSYAIFLPIVFVAYWALPHKFRWILLLISSYFFYMSWSPKYVFLILGTTVVSYFAAIAIEKTETAKNKKVIMAIAAIICLGILFVFKYFNFAIQSICGLFGLFVDISHPLTLSLVLPVGISFYTFQTLSYVIDVYRGTIQAERHFGYYAVFISFFPQLVAGPIERSNNLLPQLKKPKHFEYAQGSYGMRLMLIGFLKKIVIADTLAAYVDIVYKDVIKYSGFSLILVILFFTVQIYCDFSGYSDIAIGSAKLLGINLMTNFKSPYMSENIREFWSRWHISLSTWFKDYIYIPLGGNRVKKIKHKMNLLITMLVSGLWHGANWTFVVWGAVHGIAQICCGGQRKTKNPLVQIIKIVVTFAFCNLAWVLFRAQSLSDAWYIYSNIFKGFGPEMVQYFHDGFHAIGFGKWELFKMAIAIFMVMIIDIISLKRDPLKEIEKKPLWIRWMIYLGVSLVVIFFMATTKDTQFIYFQF